MPGGEDSSAPFTSSRAWHLLGVACEELGLPREGADLVRLGENAIFRLPGKRVVVRVGRSLDKLPVVERELCVARWLDGEGVPVTRPFDGVAQPVVIGQHPVSIQHLVEEGAHRPGVEDLAVLLRKVHSLDGCPCDLPVLDPLTLAEQRLQVAAGLGEDDRAFMLRRASELRAAFGDLEFALAVGLIHGDAHTAICWARRAARS